MDNKLKEKLDEENKEYEAVKELHDMGAKQSVTDHDHYFRLVRGTEAQCSCGWGLFIQPNELIDGHVYADGKLVI